MLFFIWEGVVQKITDSPNLEVLQSLSKYLYH
uniref:Uncharacterized protein n=1 Tax=viral metagenome TaxID=1070528 RepID=A0A6C0ACY4_9ZZZZ